MVRRLRGIRAETPELREAAHFVAHAERMRYAEFRRQDLLAGSGVIEAGCRTVLGRLKRWGMFWPVVEANAIIAFRSAQFANRIDNYWKDRAEP